MKAAWFVLGLCLLGSWASVHSQGSTVETWELVRAFEELAFPRVPGQTPERAIGGFDFDEQGNIVTYDATKGLLHRYTASSGFVDRETVNREKHTHDSARAWVGANWGYFYGDATTYAVALDPTARVGMQLIDFMQMETRGDGFGFPMVVGDLIIARTSRGYSSIQVQFDNPDQEPEYRDAAATREMIEERGEELGLYFDEAGYLWARDEPHDWLVTSDPQTFNEVFGLSQSAGVFGDFAGRDREGNYYWGGAARYKVISHDGDVLADRIQDGVPRPRTGMRVSLDGVLMVFSYNGKPYNFERERLDLYRLDTGIITGR